MGITVVIGFAEALPAPEVTWSLADQGLNVVAFSRRGGRPALLSSRYVSLFEITPPEVSITSAVVELKKRISALNQANPQGVAAIMPLDDVAIWLCNQIDPGLKVPIIGPVGDAAILAVDKWKQIEHATKAGFSVPSTKYAEKTSDVFADPLDFPVVLKPARAVTEIGGRLTKGEAWLCSDSQELKTAVEIWAQRWPMLVQQFVSGVGEGLFGLATTRGVVGWSAHRRLRMMNPQGSGSSACTSIDVDEGLKAAAERFVAECGWQGLFMIELLRDASGKAWFMELNGRPWGSMALARRMGFEYPAWAVQAVLTPDARINVPQRRNGPLVCRHFARELLYLLYALRGPKSKTRTGWPSPWTALHQIVRFNRKHRWYNWRTDDRRVFVRDLFWTLRSQLFKTKG